MLYFRYVRDSRICSQNKILNAASNITTSSVETCAFLPKQMEPDYLAETMGREIIPLQDGISRTCSSATPGNLFKSDSCII